MNLSGLPAPAPQYWTEWDERGERLVMPIRRGWKVIGSALVTTLLASLQHMRMPDDDPSLFDYAVFAFLGIGALHFTLNAVTSLVAREVIRIEAGMLIHGWEVLGLKREKRYSLREIFALSADREVSLPQDRQLFSPLRDFGSVGAVNFDYKDKTVALGAAIDNAHAQGLVDWIARRSPRTVFDLVTAPT